MEAAVILPCLYEHPGNHMVLDGVWAASYSFIASSSWGGISSGVGDFRGALGVLLKLNRTGYRLLDSGVVIEQYVFTFTSLLFSSDCHEQLLPRALMMIAWWDSLCNFLIKCL